MLAALCVMNGVQREFEQSGFFSIDQVIGEGDVSELAQKCDELSLTGAGSRNLLSLEWVQALSTKLASHRALDAVLPSGFVPVQCTYFAKSEATNWLVPLHRDTSIPVAEKFEHAGWSGWSRKEGCWFVRPPESVLRNLVAVRLHLEANTSKNGALQLVPGSHRGGSTESKRKVCEVSSGGVLVMASPSATRVF